MLAVWSASLGVVLHAARSTPPRVHAAHSRAADSPRMGLKLELNPEETARLLEDGPAASQGPFGKGGALEGVANSLDALAEVTLGALHAFDDKEVQDSSKNLQARRLGARSGALMGRVLFL